MILKTKQSKAWRFVESVKHSQVFYEFPRLFLCLWGWFYGGIGKRESNSFIQFIG